MKHGGKCPEQGLEKGKWKVSCSVGRRQQALKRGIVGRMHT